MKYDGPDDWPRGPAGNREAVEIDNINHLQLINYWLALCGLPSELANAVLGHRMTRTYLHELGHTFGINHHVPETGGSHDCVMKYEVEMDLFPWEDYTWGLGYLLDEWNCASEKGLRP